ncbi:MAG: CopG family transcripitonal regulator [Desulfatitalea sp. BRH_c12]|nr:MAG: CopG family transcripitonal regulator [Desulfatitalea sp. BRH_c12]
MGQVTIYLDTETERKLNAIIREKKVSKSKWIADLIRHETDSCWPQSIIDAAGTWKDMPTAETIRKKIGKDVKREAF